MSVVKVWMVASEQAGNYRFGSRGYCGDGVRLG